MTHYVCSQLDTAMQACATWVVYNASVLEQLNNVTPDQFWSLFTKTAFVFLVAWGWNKIDYFISQT